MELPEGVSFAQAAAIPHDFTLALEALQEVAQLAPRERLLVIGADSSLGSAVASLGWCLGADVSALLAESAPGEDALSSELRALNPSHAVEWLRHTTVGPEGDLDPHFAARRFDVVVDLCDQLRREALLGLLARGGRWLISSSSKGDISLPSKRWAEHEQQLLGVAPPISDALRRIALIQRARRTILPRLSDGQLRPWLDSNHGFYEAHHARARALRTTPHGKVILSTD
jgi:NADPH:quinone reductase